MLVMMTKSKNPIDAVGLRVTLVAVEASIRASPVWRSALGRRRGRQTCAAVEAAKPGRPSAVARGKTAAEEIDDTSILRRIMSATPARPLPPAVRDKLGKLLPLLSSDHNGERVGAVAAIERVLKSAGLDWHDLTGVITATPQWHRRPHRHALRPPKTTRPWRCSTPS